MIGSEYSVRAARLTDRQALADLSRQVHTAEDAYRRSLGVPAPSAARPRISLSALIPSWLPLRSPSVHLVAEAEGELVGSCRAIEEPHRDDWAIIELDAADTPDAPEIRFALLQALVEEGAQRGVGRFHAACSDVHENLELFGQTGFMAYAQEEIFYRPPEMMSGARSWMRGLFARNGRAARGRTDDPPTSLRPAGAPDAWHLFDLWAHATPPAIARAEGYSAGDWESVGHEAIVPRSSLNPILHFAEVDAWVLPTDQRAGGLAQRGACRQGPHYLRFLIRDSVDGAAFLRSVLEAAGDETLAAGILSPVRTYESAGLRAAEAVGFEAIGRVTLLVREVRAQIREPAMVPAIH
ncbi:MAG: GNAT family N-acetyltransferase [Chloroflexota bacterium]|nr:GNAT family N-acetyltransferase [Chloroflexota bacterium]